MRALWHVLVGPPVRARDVSRGQITPVEGLSALSLDALTSVAYGPEAIIAVLAVAGVRALHLVLPVTVAIVVLLAILVFSYRQVIDAYRAAAARTRYRWTTSGHGSAWSPRRRLSWTTRSPSRSPSRLGRRR
jgi:hypothetical protein